MGGPGAGGTSARTSPVRSRLPGLDPRRAAFVGPALGTGGAETGNPLRTDRRGPAGRSGGPPAPVAGSFPEAGRLAGGPDPRQRPGDPRAWRAPLNRSHPLNAIRVIGTRVARKVSDDRILPRRLVLPVSSGRGQHQDEVNSAMLWAAPEVPAPLPAGAVVVTAMAEAPNPRTGLRDVNRPFRYGRCAACRRHSTWTKSSPRSPCTMLNTGRRSTLHAASHR